MITFNINPTTFLFWLAVISMLFNVVLIVALYRTASGFMLLGELAGANYPALREMAELLGKQDATKLFGYSKTEIPK